MINRLAWIQTGNTNPYKNLAMEEYMTASVPPGVCVLYLWQNRHTVVIGRNQNCWRECRADVLEQEGGYLARRLSGGGAVFHDLGNLNFTFMCRAEDYDVSRQIDVILEAVRMWGIKAEKTGRNDITADGRKFSGNAFYRTRECCCHHGTLLLNAVKGDMSRYLNVSKEKLASKGVASVSSRVVNLCELNPELTISGMKERLAESFSKVYRLPAVEMKEDCLPSAAVEAMTRRFASWEWIYGRKIPFDYEIERRFPWGEIQLQFHVNAGLIQEIKVYTDAMEQELAGALEKALTGIPYGAESICRAIGTIRGWGSKGGPEMDIKAEDAQSEKVKADIISFLRERL